MLLTKDQKGRRSLNLGLETVKKVLLISALPMDLSAKIHIIIPSFK